MTLDFLANSSLQKQILVCIPAFNEENNIAAIVKQAKQYATDVIVYDDGSTDKTSEIAQKEGALVIRNVKNRGYGKAINALFRAAILRNADIVVTLDSDGQHNPDQIPRILQPLIIDEADIVIGSRFLTKEDKKNVPTYRSLGIKALTKMTQVACFDKITDAQSGFRGYNLNALSKLNLYENGMAISTEILLKANEFDLRIVEVPITISYGEDGSTHNPISHGFSVLTQVLKYLSFKKPLLFYGLPGLALIIVGIVFMYNALDLFSATRYVSTNMIIISLGFDMMGILLLATSAIIYTIITIFKGKLRE